MRTSVPTTSLLISIALSGTAHAAGSLSVDRINTDDGLLQTDLSPAILDNRRFVGSGVSETFFTPSLTAMGTDLQLAQIYSEPDAVDITTYTVRPGDTLESIARMFRVSQNTIRWQNDIKRGDKIRIGQQLIILPVTGVLHTVQRGDTLAKIAKLYKASQTDISQFNDILLDSELIIGTKIIIPDGEKQDVAPPAQKPKTLLGKVTNIITKPFVRGKWNNNDLIVNGYMHPTKFIGTKTQGYHHGWRAIDIGIPVGTPIYASMEGRVKIANKSGYGGGYGHYVYIEHSNGSGTMYAHMSTVSVSPGQRVSRGEQIGKSGNTGRSTGPHLHFEIRPPRGKSVYTWFPIPW